MKQRLTVLGATGSIGVSTLDVVRRHPGRYEIFALSCARNVERLAAQINEFIPRFAVVTDAQAAVRLQQLLGPRCCTEVLVGSAELVTIAQHPDVDAVMAAIVGAAGLLPTLAAAPISSAAPSPTDATRAGKTSTF